ncbi:MAG: hypothetical protein IPL53_08405 [Ignavibacteria bacterium]|nr:hypothetical protein [Ignavibacteria bacterium]
MTKEEEDEFYDGMEEANKFRLGEMTGWKIIEAVKNNNVDEVKRLMTLPVDEGDY